MNTMMTKQESEAMIDKATQPECATWLKETRTLLDSAEKLDRYTEFEYRLMEVEEYLTLRVERVC